MTLQLYNHTCLDNKLYGSVALRSNNSTTLQFLWLYDSAALQFYGSTIAYSTYTVNKFYVIFATKVFMEREIYGHTTVQKGRKAKYTVTLMFRKGMKVKYMVILTYQRKGK